MLSPTCRAKWRGRHWQRESRRAWREGEQLVQRSTQPPAVIARHIRGGQVTLRNTASSSGRVPAGSGTRSLKWWPVGSGRHGARYVINPTDSKARFPALSKLAFSVRARRMCRCTQCEWAFGTVHRRTLMHVELRRRKSPYRTQTCWMRRRTAPYARLTQATQGPKHASNLTHLISRDKFQPCH